MAQRAESASKKLARGEVRNVEAVLRTALEFDLSLVSQPYVSKHPAGTVFLYEFSIDASTVKKGCFY